jgi:cyanate lyase
MKTKRPITDVLLQAIAASGLPFLTLEQKTGVVRQSLMKFVRGERHLRGDSMDRLAEFFDLELQPKRKGR